MSGLELLVQLVRLACAVSIAMAIVAVILSIRPERRSTTVTTIRPHGRQPGDLVEIRGRLFTVQRVSSCAFEMAAVPWYTRLRERARIGWHNHRVRAAVRAHERQRLRYEGRDLPNSATCASSQVSTSKLTNQNAAQLGADIAAAAEKQPPSFN